MKTLKDLTRTLSSDHETPLSFVTQEHALSGAMDWKTYSWGGSSMCYNSDIIEKYNCETAAWED